MAEIFANNEATAKIYRAIIATGGKVLREFVDVIYSWAIFCVHRKIETYNYSWIINENKGNHQMESAILTVLVV